RAAGLDLDHGDAIVHWTYPGAKIAAYAVLIAYHRPQALVGFTGEFQILEIDTLVGRIITGDKAQVALDALAVIDLRNSLEAQIKVSKGRDAGDGFADQLIYRFVAFVVHPVGQAVDHVFHNAEAPVHCRGAHLNRGCSQQNELERVLPCFDPTHSGYGNARFLHFLVAGDRAQQVESNRLDCRPGVTAVAAFSTHIRLDFKRVEIDADDTVDSVDQRYGRCPALDGSAGRMDDICDIGSQLDDDRLCSNIHHPLGDHARIFGHLTHCRAHAA